MKMLRQALDIRNRLQDFLRLWFMEKGLDPCPLRHHFKGYRWATFYADIKAGMNVAFVAFPQAMAYALIAGIPIQHGIFCAVVASIVGGMFCKSPMTVLGPTNGTAVLVLTATTSLAVGGFNSQSLCLLGVMVGVILMGIAVFRLANLIQFISYSVILGYVTGAAILIVANQLNLVLGLKPAETVTLWGQMSHLFHHFHQVHWPSVWMGWITFGVWVLVKRYLKALPGTALTLGVSSVVGIFFDQTGFALNHVPSLEKVTWVTVLPVMSPWQFGQLAGFAMAIALISAIEWSTMAKPLAYRTGQSLDANQDLFGVGLSNLFSSFLGGMPASGSLTRSALNWSSGAQTPWAAIWSGILCLIGFLFFGRWVGFIPLSALATVVMCVAFLLISPRQIQIILKSTKSDAVVFGVTLISTFLIPLNFAIYIGVSISIMLFLRKVRMPSLIEYTFNEKGELCASDPLSTVNKTLSISIVHVEGELFFGAADLFLDQIRRLASDPQVRVVILRLKNARHMDATSVIALEELVRYLRETGRELLVSGVTFDSYKILHNSGLDAMIGHNNIFLSSPKNPNLSTRSALMRAQAIVEVQNPGVRIFGRMELTDDFSI